MIGEEADGIGKEAEEKTHEKACDLLSVGTQTAVFEFEPFGESATVNGMGSVVVYDDH